MPRSQNKLPLLKLLTTIYIFIASFSILFSCKKPGLKEIESEKQFKTISEKQLKTVQISSSNCDLNVTTCEDCAFQETIENDTTEYTTVLGGTYTNPYSIQAMTQAYNNVHGTNIQSVSTTHYYVRFKPQTANELNILDSLDLELYDHPLDREILQDGDYWPDAYTNLGSNEYP